MMSAHKSPDEAHWLKIILQRKHVRRLTAMAGAVLALVSGGCTSLGPTTVARDREDYVTAVADSWKEQILLNIVRMRYADAPSFVEVSSLISAYQFQGQLSAAGQISSNLTSNVPSNLVTLGGNATYQDRPTITYTPVIGEKFANSLLRPIPPSAIFELIQAGYPADAVLQLTIRAINGVYNRSSLAGLTREADPNFYPLLDALRRLQLSGGVSLRLEKRRGNDESATLIFAGERSAEAERDFRFVRQALGISAGPNDELDLTFGARPRNDKEIAVLSRSMLGILLEVANGIDVPALHVAEGRAVASARTGEAENLHDRPLIRIESGANLSAHAFAAVHYHDTWYWISDGDFGSKRVFTFLMMFFSLAETGVTPQTPVLTVPAS